MEASDPHGLDAMARQNELLAEQIRLMKEMRSVSQGLNPKEVKRVKRRAAAELKRPASKRAATRRVGTLPKNLNTEKLTVKNPVNGKAITLGGKSTAFRNIVKAASLADWDPRTDDGANLANVLVQAARQGLKDWDPAFIPKKFVKVALRSAGIEVSSSESSGTDSTSSEGEGRPTEVEDFVGKFKRYHYKMSENGKSMQSDFAAIKSILVRHLQRVLTSVFDGRAFKIYLQYEFIMERGAHETEQGGHMASEEQLMQLSSATKDRGMQTIRTLQNCEDMVLLALQALLDLFGDITHQGSGWNWVRSVGMDIFASRKVDRVSIRGTGGEAVIASEMARQAQTVRTSGG